MKLGVNGRFYAAQVTGVQRFALEVARRLFPEAVLLLPADAAPPPDLPAPTRVVRGRLRGHVWEQVELPLLARRAGCDVVLHMGGTAPLLGRGGVVVVHDLLPLTHPGWFTRRFRVWRTAVMRGSVPRAARVVAVSEWVRDEVVRVLGVPAKRVVVAVQGIAPFDRPAPPEAVAEVRARHGLDEPFLLAVGADPRKNLPFLGQVLLRWRERHGDPPRLAVVGAPLRHLFTPATGWPAGLDVRSLGHVDDGELHALYTAAAALCFPSLAEGFGRPPLEALACGTPTVVADYATAPEVLGGAARILPLDPDAWVDALVPLVDADNAEREVDSDVARRYRWEETVEQVRAACDCAAAESHALVV